MAQYVTKNLTATRGTILVYDMDENKLDTLLITLNGKASDKDFEKYLKESNHYKFIKVESATEVDDLRRVETEKFMAYAHKLQPSDKRANMVTRTISEYKTDVLCYNLETDQLETLTMNFEVTNVRKCDLAHHVAIKVTKVTKTDILYGMSIECFDSISESFER